MKRIGAALLVCAGLVFAAGCESFARKFTRKPRDRGSDVDVVLVPESYESQRMSGVEQALESYVFWKSWHAELVAALDAGHGHKRRVHCASEALSSLRRFSELLKEEAAAQAQAYARELADFVMLVEKDASGMRNAVYARQAAGLQRRIERSFRYSRVGEYVRE